MTTPESPGPRRPIGAAAIASKWRRPLLITAALLCVLGLSVWYGDSASVARSIKLHGYEPGTPASTILREMGPATTDFVPSGEQRSPVSPRTARVMFYDTAPWFLSGSLMGVSLEFDGENRLLQTWNVVE